jgi:hypothetical protein
VKFRIQVGRFKKDGRAEAWWEEFDEDTTDADKCAEEMIANFNNTLWPGERPRFVVQTEVLDTDSIKDHDWGKTNLVTIIKGSQSYDTCRCNRCGITGKRFGLGAMIRRDAKYRSDLKYARCDTSLAHRKRLGVIRA